MVPAGWVGSGAGIFQGSWRVNPSLGRQTGPGWFIPQILTGKSIPGEPGMVRWAHSRDPSW